MSDLVISVPPELFAPAESSSFEGAYDLPVFKNGPDLYSFDAPLAWRVDISNVGDALLLEGTLEGYAETSCGRCLDSVDYDVVAEVEGYFLLPDTQAPKDAEGDEFDVLGDDGKIDLEPLFTQALLLELPLVPLCKDDCLGLCPECGTNWNHAECGCDAGEEVELPTNNPFAVLLDIDYGKE